MAEHAFFPLQHVEGSCPNMDVPGETSRVLSSAGESSRENLLDELLGSAKLKSDIISHPLYEQLLGAHVSCLHVASPVDHLETIQAQLANKHNVALKYLMLGRDVSPIGADNKHEIDEFMENYILLLQSFKKQLQEHLQVHALQAISSCRELKQALHDLTGVSYSEETSVAMADAELQDEGSDFENCDAREIDGLGVGELSPTNEERSLMEFVRRELRLELKQNYRENLTAVREEILRKRRAGKLAGDISILKNWWDAHSKWPYPTEEEKKTMVQQTGLEIKQINNWFINHRKRNWHGRTLSTPVPRSGTVSMSNASNFTCV